MSKKPSGRGRNWARGQRRGIPAVVGNNPELRHAQYMRRWEEHHDLWTAAEEQSLKLEIIEACHRAGIR